MAGSPGLSALPKLQGGEFLETKFDGKGVLTTNEQSDSVSEAFASVADGSIVSLGKTNVGTSSHL